MRIRFGRFSPELALLGAEGVFAGWPLHIESPSYYWQGEKTLKLLYNMHAENRAAFIRARGVGLIGSCASMVLSHGNTTKEGRLRQV